MEVHVHLKLHRNLHHKQLVLLMIDKTFAHWLNCSFIMQMNSNYMGKVHTAGVAAS